MKTLDQIREFFSDRYRSTSRYWWNFPHAYSVFPDDHAGSLMAQQILRYAISRGPGRALDLGSGEGADAIRLARLGWEVEAVELSEVGADKISKFASEVGVSVKVHRADLADFVADELFDLVICNGVLHYVEDKQAACRRIQDMTTPGGVNAVSLWSDYTPVPECHRVVPTFPDEERGVVVTEYADWSKTLMYFERFRGESGHNDMPSHVHSYIKLIANKPVGESG
ncbi:class I SAM-dependent methyltransferase [Micromonospora vinacea]|uniref:class I SAM-dependent methyltransferase n=1 Tax=Micromonospora vinacea TaxID=709878 RepID=UPI0034503191